MLGRLCLPRRLAHLKHPNLSTRLTTDLQRDSLWRRLRLQLLQLPAVPLGQLLEQRDQPLTDERVQLPELGRHVGQRRQTVGVQVLVLWRHRAPESGQQLWGRRSC